MISLSHVIRQHADLPNFSTVLLDPNELAVDLTTATSVTLKMQLIGDPSVSGGGSVDIIEPTAGQVSYNFSAADTQISGSYLATIQVVTPAGVQSFPFNDYFLFQVEPDLEVDLDDPLFELVFATVEQARAAGWELTKEQLIRAQGHIEIMCGRMVESIQDAMEDDLISRQDLKRLRMATIYQAVWLAANEDVEERTDVTQIRTAGLSGESATLTTDGVTLAPLATRCLRGLSWVRSRSIKTTTSKSSFGYSLNTTYGGGWNMMR